MLSAVYLAGKLGEVKEEGVRIIEVEAYIPTQNCQFKTQHIPVRCRLGKKSYFFTADEGSLVIVKGRLEEDPNYGIIVVNEIDEIYSNKSGVTKTLIRES